MSWLENPEMVMLTINLTTAGMLIPSHAFPGVMKTKSSYVVRTWPCAITEENVRDVLICGDISPKPLDEMIIILEKV